MRRSDCNLSLNKNVLAGAHKKSERVQHTEIYLLGLKVQYKHKTKLPLDMVSKHVLLSVQRPDYLTLAISFTTRSFPHPISLEKLLN